MTSANIEMLAKQTLQELQGHREVEREWVVKHDLPVLEFGRPRVAEGKCEFGGLGAGSVLLELTFHKTGEKWNFNGLVFGNVEGLSESVGIYTGDVPKDGDHWWFHTNLKDVGIGAFRISFSPLHGIFAGPSAGGGNAGLGNGGRGYWRKG